MIAIFPFSFAVGVGFEADVVPDHVEIIKSGGNGLEGLDSFEPPLELPVEVLGHDIGLWDIVVDDVSCEPFQIGVKERDHPSAGSFGWVFVLVPTLDDRELGRDSTTGLLV